MTPRRSGLSKSRIALFEQCPKRLWLSVHRPELGEDSAAVQASFAQGHVVGDLACALHPDGHMISGEQGLTATVAETAQLLASGWDRPIFEASFAHDDILVRVDLLLPLADGWHVAEVKSTTSVKAYHLGDLATQIWTMRQAGITITAASIRHLESSFVLTRAGDYQGIFHDRFVDADIAPLVASRHGVIAAARTTLAGNEPAREIGAHCDDPFTCSFKGYCGRDLPPPPDWPASLLPDVTGKKLARSWAEQGVVDLMRIPASAMTSPKLQRIHAATLSAVVFHDAAAFAAEVDGWAWPRTFLDFETIQFAVPRWLGTSPYAQVPFQFSAHIDHGASGIEHRDYLSIDGSDPRRGCAEALAALPNSGAVIAWNMSFERRCLLELAALFADLAPALRALAARLVDLLPVTRRHYYHRDMRGSWSIKAVLPTLAPELGYDQLGDVRSGTDAQAGYLEAIDGQTPLDRREQLRTALIDYCRRDTEAMMVVLDRLSGQRHA